MDGVIGATSAADTLTPVVERRLLTLLTRTKPGDSLTTDPFTTCRRALVLAPHFDDEVIACGGAILRHVARGHAVTVLYFTDGSAAKGSSLSPQELTAVRMAESARSNAILGVQHEIHLLQPDGGLRVTGALVDRLAPLAGQADIIYAPHAHDAHQDHQAVYQLLQIALGRIRRRPALAYYEFWHPQVPNWYLDVSDLMETKIRALREHESQLRFLDYVRLMTALNQYRGGHTGTAYAEAYHYSPAQSTEEV